MKAFVALIVASATASPVYGQHDDISIATDLGEKYIIKMSAVYIEDRLTRSHRLALQYVPRIRGLTEDATRLKQNMLQTDADYKNCIQAGFGKKHCHYNKNSPAYSESERQRLEYVEANIAKIKEEMHTKAKLNPHAVEVALLKYRPIFADLNNQKTALEYRQIMCVSPAVPADGLASIVDRFPPYRVVSSSGIALEAAERKLCQRITCLNQIDLPQQ